MLARSARSVRRAGCALLATVAACSGGHAPSGGRPPNSEFLVSTQDSAFWIATTSSATRVRGAPIVLARFDGRFFELYSADDDFSYQDALLVGERLYRRDLTTGDSALVFVDTMIPRIATAYARSHPDERPLHPDEDGEARPSTSATSQIDVLDVAGPYLSYEYHADITLPHRRLWHTTWHGVIDLRSGKEASLGELFGTAAEARLIAAARRGYATMRDSVARERASLNADERRAADALAHLDFDDRSFSLSSDEGTLQVRFAVPGRGEGAAGNILELEPLPVDSVAWWNGLATGAAKTDDAGNDHWTGAGYRVLARYDSAGEVARLSLADSAHREWPLTTILGPVRRIDWLDRPPVSAPDRKALLRAFNQAASYDENARVATAQRHAPRLLPVRLTTSTHRQCVLRKPFPKASTKRPS